MRLAVAATVFALAALHAQSPGAAAQTAGADRPSQTARDSAADLAPTVDRLAAEVARLGALVDSLRAAASAAAGAAAGPAAASPAATDPGGTPPIPAAEPAQARTDAEEVLDTAANSARRWGFRSMVALLLLVLTAVVVRFSSWLLGALAERTARRRLLFKRVEPIVRVVLWAVAVVVILRLVFDVDTTTLLTAGAAVGVAIGFAAQDILKNIFGGLVIIGDRPFQVGDKISVEGTYGEVVGIGLRSTRIVTPDDSLVTVPNAQVVDGQVSNANSGALDCQVVTDLWLPGWVDVARARELAYRAAVTSRFVYLKKPVVVLVQDRFDETFHVMLRVKAYVLDIRFEFAFMSDVTERARAAFRAEGLLPAWHGAQPRVEIDPSAPPPGGPRG